jgi:glycosyltransferase involved in cell wall biosynthesis
LKNVLFLVAEFYPVNTTGSYRPAKFVKYLQQFGYRPIVVTLKKETASSIFGAPIQLEQLSELPSNVKVIEIDAKLPVQPTSKIKKFTKHFFSLDDGIGGSWQKNVTSQIATIIKNESIELLYTTLPPFSVGILASKIASAYRIPFVVDMRDLWSYWGSNPHQSIVHFWLKKKIERKVFKSASRIIGVTPQLNHIFQYAHPNISSKKFEVITNGYDTEKEIPTSINLLPKSKYVIGYTGSFYYEPSAAKIANTKWWKRQSFHKLNYYPQHENWLYRSPYFFLKTLASIQPILRQKKIQIEFHLIGKTPAWLIDMISHFELQDVFVSHGFLPKKDAEQMQQLFDIILCTSEKVENQEHYCLPSKLFDYITINKPLLGFVTDGIQKEFIQQSGLGICVNPDNQSECENAMLSILSGVNLAVNRSYLHKFHRKNLTKQLASTFDSIVAST